MADTLPNVRITTQVWTDLYAGSGIPVGTAVSVENVGTCDVQIAIQAARPNVGHESFSIVQRNNGLEFKAAAGSSGLWAFCNSEEGLLNVKESVQSESANFEQVIAPSDERTETFVGPDLMNPNAGGAHFIVNVSALSGLPRIQLIVQGKDPASGEYYNIFIANKYAAIGVHVSKIHTGLAGVPGICVSDILPKTFRTLVSHSNTDPITYSLSVVTFP